MLWMQQRQDAAASNGAAAPTASLSERMAAQVGSSPGNGGDSQNSAGGGFDGGANGGGNGSEPEAHPAATPGTAGDCSCNHCISNSSQMAPPPNSVMTEGAMDSQSRRPATDPHTVLVTCRSGMFTCCAEGEQRTTQLSAAAT